MNGPVAPPVREDAPLALRDAGRRPSVWQVFCALPSLDATRVCRALGYSHAQIAAGAGVTRSAISYRLRSVPAAAHSPGVPGTWR